MKMIRQYHLSRRSSMDRLPGYELPGVLLREEEPYSTRKDTDVGYGGGLEIALFRATYNGKACILCTRTRSTAPGQREDLYWDSTALEAEDPIEV